MNGRRPPQSVQLMWPVLQALKHLGGSGTARQIHDWIVENRNSSGMQPRVIPESGEVSSIGRHLQDARSRLKALGAIESKSRGLWTITETGRSVTAEGLLAGQVGQQKVSAVLPGAKAGRPECTQAAVVGENLQGEVTTPAVADVISPLNHNGLGGSGVQPGGSTIPLPVGNIEQPRSLSRLDPVLKVCTIGGGICSALSLIDSTRLRYVLIALFVGGPAALATVRSRERRWRRILASIGFVCLSFAVAAFLLTTANHVVSQTGADHRPHLALTLDVRNTTVDPHAAWSPFVTARPGETVQWLLTVLNDGGEDLHEIVARAVAAPNMVLVGGSIRYIDSGQNAVQDNGSIFNGGINFGTYGVHGGMYLLFSTIAADIPQCQIRVRGEAYVRATETAERGAEADVEIRRSEC